MKSNIAISTITSYKNLDETRFKLTCRMFQKAKEAGYPVFAIDNSPKEIRNELESTGANVYECPEHGMGAERRSSVWYASKFIKRFDSSEIPSIIIMTEPEKDALIQWIPKITEPIIDGTADIVIPSRTDVGFESFPWFQAESEKIADMIYSELIGVDADPFLGPVAFRSDIAPRFYNCNPAEYGLEDNYIQFVAPIVAKKDGLKVYPVRIDFIYPPEQKAEEEGSRFSEMVKRRQWQQKQLIKTFLKLR